MAIRLAATEATTVMAAMAPLEAASTTFRAGLGARGKGRIVVSRYFVVVFFYLI